MVVRMRKNRSQTKQGRSHQALKDPALSTCSHCGALHRPHHMCLECGYYNGRQVMDLEAEKVKRDARIKAKQERITAELGDAEPETTEVSEPVPAEDDSKKATEENDTDNRPEKKPE